MKIVYASRTGNVESFINKLGHSNVLEIKTGDEKVNEKFVIITYTDGYGEVPQEVDSFLANNANYVVGVAASGDTGYGEAYCLSADVIADTYGVPILLKFENEGTDEDIEQFRKELAKI